MQEAKCYQALLDDGWRPLFPIGLLLQVLTPADAYRDLLRPWTRYPATSDSEDWQVFSRQLRRCQEFREWQLSKRGNAEAVLARHAEVAKKLLMDHGFVQPFHLHANPEPMDDQDGIHITERPPERATWGSNGDIRLQ
jgi:hypothetical protein